MVAFLQARIFSCALATLANHVVLASSCIIRLVKRLEGVKPQQYKCNVDQLSFHLTLGHCYRHCLYQD